MNYLILYIWQLDSKTFLFISKKMQIIQQDKKMYSLYYRSDENNEQNL